MRASRTVIINADDVGLHPAVDEAVARLAEIGVVTSASVMTLGRPDAGTLRTCARYGVDLGLHLDFTSDMANRRYRAARTIGSLILETWCGRLDAHRARDIVADQLQRFLALTGAAPAFVDGHEHAHQLPVIRDALLAVLREHGCGATFIRSTRPRRWRGAKAALIGLLGARRLEAQARHAGHRCNSDFCGVYNLREDARLEALWRTWLQTMPQRGALAVCHPATPGMDGGADFRVREYRFLSSTAFDDLLRRHDTTTTNWAGAAGYGCLP